MESHNSQQNIHIRMRNVHGCIQMFIYLFVWCVFSEILITFSTMICIKFQTKILSGEKNPFIRFPKKRKRNKFKKKNEVKYQRKRTKNKTITKKQTNKKQNKEYFFCIIKQVINLFSIFLMGKKLSLFYLSIVFLHSVTQYNK